LSRQEQLIILSVGIVLGHESDDRNFDPEQ